MNFLEDSGSKGAFEQTDVPITKRLWCLELAPSLDMRSDFLIAVGGLVRTSIILRETVDLNL